MGEDIRWEENIRWGKKTSGGNKYPVGTNNPFGTNNPVRRNIRWETTSGEKKHPLLTCGQTKKTFSPHVCDMG